MSVIHVKAKGNGLDRATRLLAGIENGTDRALKSAMTRAVSYLRSNTVKAIQEKYAISAANVRSEENVKVKYTFSQGVQATINFRGFKIPLFRYQGASPGGPTFDQSALESVMVGGTWKKLHPGVQAKGHVFKVTSPMLQYKSGFPGFVARMPSGHTGIFVRTGGVAETGHDEIKEIMGLSVPQMLGNEEVEQRLGEESMEKFEERLDHEIIRLLNGW